MVGTGYLECSSHLTKQECYGLVATPVTLSFSSVSLKNTETKKTVTIVPGFSEIPAGKYQMDSVSMDRIIWKWNILWPQKVHDPASKNISDLSPELAKKIFEIKENEILYIGTFSLKGVEYPLVGMKIDSVKIEESSETMNEVGKYPVLQGKEIRSDVMPIDYQAESDDNKS
ncbi:MAG: hypothetical protein HQM12_24325 [SAR324 cluster bacterium]|nr:hypothetical protein [SAR324 cluster bacterium]